MEFGQKKFHEFDLFDFTSFFGLDFFKFSRPLTRVLGMGRIGDPTRFDSTRFSIVALTRGWFDSRSDSTYIDSIRPGFWNCDPRIRWIRTDQNQQCYHDVYIMLTFNRIHSALKLEKKCNFKSTKTHYLHFQKWQKINFFAPEKSPKIAFLVVLNFFSCAKIDFLPFLKWQKMVFLYFWNCTFFPILEHCGMP